MSSINHYVIDCNQLRRNDKIRSEVDVFVVLESDYDARDSEANAAQVELAALREELAQTKDVLATANRTLGEFADDSQIYQQRLTSAEQRNAEASAILEIIYDDPEMLCAVTMEVARRTREFLTKPTESGASE